MLQRLIPKTLAGQLITLLAIVLIFAQMVNLALLIGTQRMQAQANSFQMAMEHTTRLISQLPMDLPHDLPHALETERGGPRGAFFLSSTNAASEANEGKEKPRYNTQFQGMLADAEIEFLQTSVRFLPDGPPSDGVNNISQYYPPPPRYAASTEQLPGQRLDSGRRRFSVQEIRVAAEIRDGVWFNAHMPRRKSQSSTQHLFCSYTRHDASNHPLFDILESESELEVNRAEKTNIFIVESMWFTLS